MPLVAHINLAEGFRGGERQTAILICELAKGPWSQQLVARRGAALANLASDLPLVKLRPVYNNVIAACTALGDADIVHVHEARALQAASLRSSFSRVPYVVTRRVQKKPATSWLNRTMYRRAARVIAVSRAISDSLHSLDSQLEIEVIPDATSGFVPVPSRAAELRGRWGGRFVVGHVGALVDSHKGQREIIEVARALRDSEPDLRFVLVGGGPDATILRTLASGLDNVVFVGQVGDVGNYLAAFDVFIYPSRHEGLGSVLLDAMQSGLPIVATNVGGIPEIIQPNVNGVLCTPDDIGSMAAAVEALRADPQLRARMANNNRARALLFSPERMAAGYARIYDEVLSEN